MNPGPELDAKIADVIDLAGFIDERGEPLAAPYARENGLFGWRNDGYQKWSPSTDWNAAMEAAENVGLFEHATLLKNDEGNWFIGSGFGIDYWSSSAPTGPHAICLAILSLKGIDSVQEQSDPQREATVTKTSTDDGS